MHPVHPTRAAHPHSKLLLIEAFCFLAFTILLFLVLGAATNANPGAVLLAFFPAIVFGIIVIALIQTDHFQPTYSWLVLAMTLVIASIIYFAVPIPIVQGLDASTVLLMNGIIMAVGLAIMHSSYAHEPVVHEHELHNANAMSAAAHAQSPVVHHVVHEQAAPMHMREDEDIATVFHSIEDKVKAINFVIGRVYSVYKGGTERLRNRIRIDKGWYEDFNQIDHKDSERRRAEAVVLLSKIKDRLDLMQKPEREVFGDDSNKLRNLARDPNGSDKVIDVLVRNDKDPVKQYYDGARSFCEDAIKKLGSRGPVPVKRADTGSPKPGLRTTHDSSVRGQY